MVLCIPCVVQEAGGLMYSLCSAGSRWSRACVVQEAGGLGPV